MRRKDEHTSHSRGVDALEMPLGDLGDAVAIDEVGSQSAHEPVPVAKVLRRLGQPLIAAGGAEGVVALARVAALARAVAAVGEELWHEGELHDGADAEREQVVIHPVDVVPAVLALVVHHRHVVVQQAAARQRRQSDPGRPPAAGWQAGVDALHPHALQPKLVHRKAQVGLPVGPRAHQRVPAAEAARPVVGEGGCGSAEVEGDGDAAGQRRATGCRMRGRQGEGRRGQHGRTGRGDTCSPVG